MGSSTFSGPIRAGTDPAIGQVVMAQSFNVLQSSPNTNIVIPANSQILRMTLNVQAIWTGAATLMGIGSTTNPTMFTAAGAVDGGTFGIMNITPAVSQARDAAWGDVGPADTKIAVTSGNTGAGAGILTVEYLQNNNML